MQITFSPVRMLDPLRLSRKGGILTFNGQTVDLDRGETCPWIVSAVKTGPESAPVWAVEIILPHGGDAPEETRFPAPITLQGDGPVALPPYDAARELSPDQSADPEGQA